MSTAAQMVANQANAQHSTGPKTPQGRAAIAQNNFRHGFTGAFRMLPGEKQAEFDTLLLSFRTQHQPSTAFEGALVEKMAQHFWLAQRALYLQDTCFNRATVESSDNSTGSAVPVLCKNAEKQLALYLRYHSTHDRAFYKCCDELRKLRKDERKVEIGFESQKRKQAEAARKEAAEARREFNENRKHELHEWALLLAEAKFQHQQVLTQNAQMPIATANLSQEKQKRAA